MSSTKLQYLPEGFHSLTPYLVVPGVPKLIEFLKAVFDAEEKMRVPRPDGSIQHAEVRIGGSAVEMGEPKEGQAKTLPAALHCYLPEVDAIYERAMKAGARILTKPTDMEYGDRETDFEDFAGNHWYVGRQLSAGKIAPDGFHSVNIGLRAEGARELIGFLERAFGAVRLSLQENKVGKIVYSSLRVGDSMLEVSDAHGEWKARPTAIHYYVQDCEAEYNRAMSAGAHSLSPVVQQPYGERSGGVEDAWGNHWYIATVS